MTGFYKQALYQICSPFGKYTLVRQNENQTFWQKWYVKGLEKKRYWIFAKEYYPNSKIWKWINHDLGFLKAISVGNIVMMEWGMNGAYYRNILERNLYQSAHSPGLKPGWVFQQDNNLKHIAKLTKSWLSSNRKDVLKWLSQSSDLNLIENLWRKLKLRIQKRNLQNLYELKEYCHEEWKNVIQETCKICRDYSKCLHAVINNNDYATKY